MNEITALASLGKPQVSALPEAGKNIKSGADFSSYVTKAAQRGTVNSDIAKKDTETPEELVAYAASVQNTNNQAQTVNNDNTASEPVEAVNADVTADTQSVRDSAEEVLTPILGTEDTNALLELLGDELPDAGEGGFLSKLNAILEDMLNIQETAPVLTVQDRLAELRRQLLDAVSTPVAVTQVVVAAPVVSLEDTAPVTDTPVQAAEEHLAADATAAQEPVLPVDDSNRALLDKVRSKLSEHIAAAESNAAPDTEVNTDDAVKNDVPVISAQPAENTEEAPELETPVQTAKPAETVKADDSIKADDTFKSAQATQKETEQPEAVEKTEAKISETSVAADTAAAPVSFQSTDAAPDADTKAVTTRSIIDQIVQSSSLTKSDGTSQLEIQLRPEHLGKVSIVLTSGEDGVTAKIKTASDTVHSLLSGGLGDLVTSLKEMGVNMKNIEISKPELNWDYTRNGGQQFQNNQENKGEQSQQQSGGRILRISRPRLIQVSSTLYGNADMQPVLSDGTSIEYMA